VNLRGFINSGLLKGDPTLFGIAFAGELQPVVAGTETLYSTVASLPGTLTPTMANDLFSCSQVFADTGTLISCTASLYTVGADAGSGVTPPVIGVYWQASGVNGQSVGDFTFTGIGNAVAPGVAEPSGQGVTSTTQPVNGAFSVTSGDRFILALGSNLWASIYGVSITATMSVP